VTARRAAGALLALLLLAAPGAAAPEIRTATPADDGAHPGPGDRTEWWFVSAVDPAQDLAVAAALGAEFPGAPPATVVFLYLPDGSVATVGAPRLLTADPATDRADVRLGPDRLWSTRPGRYRLRVDMPAGIALAGASPGPVRLDLTVRATAPGFVAGPLALPGGRDLSWTVAAPSARVTGTVRAGGRTFRLRGAPGYSDHNFGRFDLGDASHGGWDWSQVHLPGGRSLVTGIVRPADPSLRDGALVLSDAGGRIAEGRARAATVRRSAWSAAGGHPYPRAVTLDARLSGGWRATVRYAARRASPLRFTRDGSSALVEVEARTAGTLRRDGRVVARWRGAPAFYEYESTPLTRERDAAPGSVARAASLARRAVAQAAA
jgi:predicted secreted hydrolase